MKKVLFIILLFSGIVSAQWLSHSKEQINDIHTRGYSLLDSYVIVSNNSVYPLTAIGLKNAIASIDSGVVYISYPGLWDTTGLGAIPSDVKLNGWLFGEMIITHGLKIKTNEFLRIGDTKDAFWENTLSPFYFLTTSIDPLAIAHYELSDPDSATFANAPSNWAKAFYIFENYFDFTKGGFSGSIGEQRSFDIFTRVHHGLETYSDDIYNLGGYTGIRSIMRFYNATTDTIEIVRGFVATMHNQTNDTRYIKKYIGYDFHLHPFSSGTNNFENIYGFYSDFSGKVAGTTISNGYHFYGAGDYPSYFGGTVVQKIYIDDISNPPTDAELDSAYPNAINGETYYIDDADGHTDFYQVVKITGGWFIFTGTKAL